jgi:hypothetical protein
MEDDMVNPEHTHRRFLSLMAQVAFVLAACLLHSPTAAFADIFAGSVSGVVKDAASGQGIEGVTVYVKKAGTTMVTASTNSLGQYKGSISSTGNYGVEVEKEGYETSFPPSVPVQVSDSSPDIVWPEILMIKSDTPLAHLTVSPPLLPASLCGQGSEYLRLPDKNAYRGKHRCNRPRHRHGSAERYDELQHRCGHVLGADHPVYRAGDLSDRGKV